MHEQEQVCDLTLRIIDKLNKHNIRCTVLTKGIFPGELGNRNGFSNKNEYGITLVSLSEKFRREFEPNSAKFKDRIDSLKYLHKKGFKTWVSIEPYPTPNLIKQDLMEILDTVSFVDKIVFGRLNYNVKSSEFKYFKEFYNDLALSVINFCKRNKISYHIKQGTQI
jgi:DNA repair photolyase